MSTADSDLFLLEESHRTFIEIGKGQIVVPFPPLWMRAAASLIVSVLCLVAAFGVRASQSTSVSAATIQNSSNVWFAACLGFLLYALTFYLRGRRLRKLETEGQILNARYVESHRTFGKNAGIFIIVAFTNPDGKEILKEQAVEGVPFKVLQELKLNTPMAVLYLNDSLYRLL